MKSQSFTGIYYDRIFWHNQSYLKLERKLQKNHCINCYKSITLLYK